MRHLTASLIVVTSVLLVASIEVRAEDTNGDAFATLAIARASAEKSLRQDATLYDGGRSGAEAAWAATDAAWEQIANTLQQAVQREEAKEEGRRDANFLHIANGKREQLELEWRAFQTKRAATRFRYEDAQRAFARMSELFDTSAEWEHRWKDAGLDLPVLEQMYKTLAKRLVETRKDVTKALEETTAARTHWEETLEEAKNVVK